MLESNLALSRQDVAGVYLTEEHFNLLMTKKYPLSVVKSLSPLMMQGISAGFSLADVKEAWFSEEHLKAVFTGLYTLDEVRGLTVRQVVGLTMGIPRELVETVLAGSVSESGYDQPAMVAAACRFLEHAGGLSKETVLEMLMIPATAMNAGMGQFVKLEKGATWEEVKKDRCYPLSPGRHQEWNRGLLLGGGYSIEEVDKLTYAQREAICQYGLTIKQALDPRFSLAAAQITWGRFSDGSSYEELLQYPRHQLEACQHAGEELSKKINIEQFSRFTPLHTFAFVIGGLSYEDIVNLNAEEVMDLLKQQNPGKKPAVFSVTSSASSSSDGQPEALLWSTLGKKVVPLPSTGQSLDLIKLRSGGDGVGETSEVDPTNEDNAPDEMPIGDQKGVDKKFKQ